MQVVAKELKQLDCYPVFLGKHLKERYYKGAVLRPEPVHIAAFQQAPHHTLDTLLHFVHSEI